MIFGFREEDIKRYSRQIILPQVGGIGQKKLQKAKVLVVGVGGLGCPASFYLVAAGIGKLGLVDSDKVELSNLHRQILHFSKDVGRSKTDSAAEKLSQLNPNVEIVKHQVFLDLENVFDLIRQYDFVVEGSDNLQTKYLVNDACVEKNIPFNVAGILQFEGQVLTVIPHKTACYRCVFPKMPPPGSIPTCQEAGVFGAITGIFGSIQASEAIKYFLDMSSSLLTNRILYGDIKRADFQEIKVERNSRCPSCGENAQPLVKSYEYSQVRECDISQEEVGGGY